MQSCDGIHRGRWEIVEFVQLPIRLLSEERFTLFPLKSYITVMISLLPGNKPSRTQQKVSLERCDLTMSFPSISPPADPQVDRDLQPGLGGGVHVQEDVPRHATVRQGALQGRAVCAAHRGG